jgi:nucleoside phosphorylase
MPDFSSIITAVKPSQRTPQYKILAAMYSLGAERTPVVVSQIASVLRLQFGNKLPSNIAGKLRTYSKYVRVFEKGSPLKWLLTEKGTQKLAALSKLDLKSTPEKIDEYSFDIAIICALEQPEFAAVVGALGGPSAWTEVVDPRFTHVYRRTQMTTVSGKVLSVVGTTSSTMGLTAAAIVTTQLIFRYKPRIVLMIGIAAGTRDGDKQFGDVLVADPSVDYNSGKVVQNDGIRSFLPDPYPLGLNARLRSVLQKYRETGDPFIRIREKWSGALPGTRNRLYIGPLGAADQVIDDASRVLEIKQNWRKLIGIEMETYGVYRACHEAPEPKPRFISFKAVCDFAAEKSDSWQTYAAFVASEFAVSFLKQEWDALWPTK